MTSRDFNGCINYLVYPDLDKDGKWVDGHWIDEPQLELIAAAVVSPIREKEDFMRPRVVGGGVNAPNTSNPR